MSTFDLMLREMRPLFRLLDEPFARPFVPFAALPSAHHAVARPRFQPLATPAVQLAEEDGTYVVEAELPGVRKEDVRVSVGDAGRSLTIAGSRTSRVARAEESALQAQTRGLSPPFNVMSAAANMPRVDSAATNANAEGTAPMTATSSQSADNTSNAVITADTQAPPRTPTPAASTSSFSFSRTIWLPQAVDAAAVSAKLADGLLTVSVPKASVAQVTEVPVL
jgi:HSP20 family molecular chaperone IbpA